MGKVRLSMHIVNYNFNYFQYLDDPLFYQAFVIFETKYWWWSIKKNNAGVTLQRSRELCYVRDMHRGGARHRIAASEKNFGTFKTLSRCVSKS